jgi:hypothetical protein
LIAELGGESTSDGRALGGSIMRIKPPEVLEFGNKFVFLHSFNSAMSKDPTNSRRW